MADLRFPRVKTKIGLVGGGVAAPTQIATNKFSLSDQSFEDDPASIDLWYGGSGVYAIQASGGYDGDKCGKVTWPAGGGSRGINVGGVDATLENLSPGSGTAYTFKIAVRFATDAGGNGIVTPKIAWWSSGYGSSTVFTGSPVDVNDGLWHPIEVADTMPASRVHAVATVTVDDTADGDVYLFDRVFFGTDPAGW